MRLILILDGSLEVEKRMSLDQHANSATWFWTMIMDDFGDILRFSLKVSVCDSIL